MATDCPQNLWRLFLRNGPNIVTLFFSYSLSPPPTRQPPTTNTPPRESNSSLSLVISADFESRLKIDLKSTRDRPRDDSNSTPRGVGGGVDESGGGGCVQILSTLTVKRDAPFVGTGPTITTRTASRTKGSPTPLFS